MDTRPRKDKFCSTFGLPTTAQEMASGTTREMCLSPFPTEAVSDEKAETAPALSLPESYSLQMESQYRVLIVNWVPPSLQNEHPKFDDQEWLFQRRQPRSDTIQKTNTCSYDFCHGSCTLYPYAHYLPEVDIYALPYTVLFWKCKWKHYIGLRIIWKFCHLWSGLKFFYQSFRWSNWEQAYLNLCSLMWFCIVAFVSRWLHSAQINLRVLLA